MIFRKCRKVDYLCLKINNNEIANVNQFCFLSIIIDENLTMHRVPTVMENPGKSWKKKLSWKSHGN